MTATATQTDVVYSTFIRATPEQVWDAIIKPEYTTKYFYGSVIDSTLEPGSAYLCKTADGSMTMADGVVIEAEAPKTFRHTWRTLWDEAAAKEAPSRISWTVEPQEDGTTKLTLVHDELDNSPATAASVAGGWPYVLSGLKTLLETGAPLAS
jgi:uncharacterized protein YndB with AHSA1/START domain